MKGIQAQHANLGVIRPHWSDLKCILKNTFIVKASTAVIIYSMLM